MTAATRPSASRTRPAPTPSRSASSSAILESNSAIRITTVPTGFVHGTVTDANDGLPIAGAEIHAHSPAAATTTTDEDGLYELRLLGRHLHVTATANLYEDGSATATVVDGADDDPRLQPPRADRRGRPDRDQRDVDFGETTTRPSPLSNAARLPLDWVARERDQGVILPPLPGTDRSP